MPLWQHMMVGHGDVRPVRRRDRDDGPIQRPRRAIGTVRVSPELLDAMPRRRGAGRRRVALERRRRPPRPAGPASATARRRRRARRGAAPLGGGPSRADVIERLDRDGLLPAITFIFSRAGCEAAVSQLLAPRTSGSSPRPRADRIRRHVEERVERPRRRGPRRCSATGSSSRGSRAGSPPTTPGCCRRSARSSRSCSPRPDPGRLRHRDAGAGHQHAGPHRRAREAGQVQRRDARRHHARPSTPSSPAGPAGAASTSRATRSCRGPARRRPARGRRPGVHAHLPAALELPTDLQHGRQPRRPGRPRDAPARSSRPRSPSSRPTGPWSAWRGTVRRNEEALEGYAEAMTCHLRRLPRVRRAAPLDPRPREGGVARARSASPAAPRPQLASRGCGSATSSEIPAGRRAGYAVVVAAGTVRRQGRGRRADRPHRGQAGAPADPGRRPRPRSSPVTHVRVPQGLQRAQAPSPGATWPRPLRIAVPHEPPPRRRARADTGGEDERISGCAASCGRTRATSAPTARTTPAGPSGGGGCRRETDGLPAQGRGPHQLGGPHLRPDLRPARRAGLPVRRRHRGDRRGADGCAGSTPSRTCSPPSACGTACGTRLDAAGPGRGRVGAGPRAPSRGGRGSPRGCRTTTSPRRLHPRWSGSGRARGPRARPRAAGHASSRTAGWPG